MQVEITRKTFMLSLAVTLLVLSTASTVFASQERYFDGREYTIVFPEKSPVKKKHPLLLILHGGASNSQAQEDALPFNRMARRNGYILVYPNGTPLKIAPRKKVWNAGGCCGPAMRHHVDDVGYLAALIKQLAKKYPVDRRRIYISGFSNGAMMAYRFACERPGMVAGIIPISGPLMTERCKSGAVKVLHIHGEEDDRVPVSGSKKVVRIVQNRPFRSVYATKRMLQDAGARIKVYIVKDAGHSLPDMDFYMKEQRSIGIPGIIARFINGR